MAGPVGRPMDNAIDAANTRRGTLTKQERRRCMKARFTKLSGPESWTNQSGERGQQTFRIKKMLSESKTLFTASKKERKKKERQEGRKEEREEENGAERTGEERKGKEREGKGRKGKMKKERSKQARKKGRMEGRKC